MNWASFLGALVGTVVGVLAVFGIMLLGFYISDHLVKPKQGQKQPPSLVDILESQLEQYVVEHFDSLFPGWKIFDEPPKGANKSQGTRSPSGVQKHTDAGEIDILAIDPRDILVVIELKRNRGPDEVVTQVDRYIAWVKKHLAKPGQKVRGLIIAKSVGNRLAYILLRRRGITVWTYEWQLRLDKRANWRGMITNSDQQTIEIPIDVTDVQ